jgi:hypothetical protein
MNDLWLHAEGCLRFWYTKWYDAYKQAHGRMAPPYWEGPPLPDKFNETHNEFTKANRLARRQKGEPWMYR